MVMPALQLDASVLRRRLFSVLSSLGADGPIEIRRNGRVVAVLTQPQAPAEVQVTTPKPHVDPRRLARICKKHHIDTLALFGSVVRDDFGPTSDVDVLYEPIAGRLTTLASLTAAREALESLFGRRVDFVRRALIEKSENRYRRASILEEARVIYENGRVKQLGRVLS